jgi:outer membrane protein assembly factor BamB
MTVIPMSEVSTPAAIVRRQIGHVNGSENVEMLTPTVSRGTLYLLTCDIDGGGGCLPSQRRWVDSLLAISTKNLSVKWSWGLGKFLEENSGVATDGTSVYAISTMFTPNTKNSVRGSTLHAVNATNGKPEWSFASNSELNPPALANGVVYVGSNRTKSGGITLAALRAADGHSLWSKVGVGGQPIVADGRLYAYSNSTLIGFGL